MEKKIISIILFILCLYSLFFVVGSISAPITAHFQQYDISGKLTSTYIFSCHQQPDRSFWILGYPIALCCRCLGFYLGVVISSLLALLKKRYMPLNIFILLFFGAFIDILTNCVFKITTHNYIRFLVGLVMGALFITLICYAFKNKEGEKDYVH